MKTSAAIGDRQMLPVQTKHTEQHPLSVFRRGTLAPLEGLLATPHDNRFNANPDPVSSIVALVPAAAGVIAFGCCAATPSAEPRRQDCAD
jgi:hypothetical protein